MRDTLRLLDSLRSIDFGDGSGMVIDRANIVLVSPTLVVVSCVAVLAVTVAVVLWRKGGVR